jgi:hypothetical protein
MSPTFRTILDLQIGQLRGGDMRFRECIERIGALIETLFSGDRLPVEPLECNDTGVPGDCDDGIS